MKNPGLSAFAAGYQHPLLEDIRPGDPDFDREDEEGEGSDWVPFSGWRRKPGHPLRVPTQQGPVFKPGMEPADVVHGEILPEEQEAADHILHGDHESNAPTANPDVEHARQQLHTPESVLSVATLGRLLNGEPASSLGPERLKAAHDWLTDQGFVGVRVNPNHGSMETMGPTGDRQVVLRHRHLPAIPGEPAETTTSLTNQHGTFESDDTERIVRTALAFSIAQANIALQKQKKKDDQNNGLGTTSGAWGDLRQVYRDYRDEQERLKPPQPQVRTDVPHNDSVAFEPHPTGMDLHNGQRGGWVGADGEVPDSWRLMPGTRTRISPGHAFNMLFNERSKQPWPDPVYEGHTFTDEYSPKTGHTEPVYPPRGNGKLIYVKKDVHPLARGPHLPAVDPVAEHPAAPSAGHAGAPIGSGVVTPPKTTTAAARSDMNDLCPVCASGYLEPFDDQHHECLNCGSLVTHVGFEKQAARNPYWDTPRRVRLKGSSYVYITGMHDNENRVHIVAEDKGIPKHLNKGGRMVHESWLDPVEGEEPKPLPPIEAARKPFVLRRGLTREDEIPVAEGDPMGISTVDSANAVPSDHPQDGPESRHPLAGETPVQDEDYVGYEAPKRILGGVHSSGLFGDVEHGRKLNTTAADLDGLDKYLLDRDWHPLHTREDQPRAYIRPRDEQPGSYYRLTELPSGWSLTHDLAKSKQPRRTGWPQDNVAVPDSEGGSQDLPLTPMEERGMPTTLPLLKGGHPLKDPVMGHAVEHPDDYFRSAINSMDYAAPPLPGRGAPSFGPTYSSVENPGLTRFVG